MAVSKERIDLNKDWHNGFCLKVVIHPSTNPDPIGLNFGAGLLSVAVLNFHRPPSSLRLFPSGSRHIYPLAIYFYLCMTV